MDGNQHRESSKSTRRADAQALLKQRIAEIAEGRFVGPNADRLSFGDVERMILDHYKTKRSLDRAEDALKHLRRLLGHRRARSLTLDVLTRYRNVRMDDGAAPATVKYELAVLRKGLNLAVRSGKLVRCPPMPEITVENTRTGFFEEEELLAILKHLPLELRGLIEAAYHTGWRTKSELMPLLWAQVDFRGGIIRLDPGTTKNGRGRSFPFSKLPRLQRVFEAQRKYTRRVQRRTGQVVPHVFHRSGRPIRDFYHAWRSACRAAGIPDRIPHDFRRTAVRNLERAGVSRSVAMQLVGHETEAIYRRYAITTERDLEEGVAKLAALSNEEQSRPNIEFENTA